VTRPKAKLQTALPCLQKVCHQLSPGCIAVPLAGWMAFQLTAVRRGVDAQEWLATVLVAAMEDGQMPVKEAITWLFPRRAE
jgi:hypothetical protein